MLKKVPKNKQGFANRVREIVKLIPKGSTMTYTEVATQAGSKKAARAVANVMATNYDVEIPCHRVIRADGTLGGYNRGGIARKKEILIAEGVQLQK